MADQIQLLKLGKGVAFVKSRLRRLRQEDDAWEVDFQLMPSWGCWAGRVISQTDYYILADRNVDESPTVNDLAWLLADAMLRPLALGSHRPTTIYLRNRPEWSELLPHLKQLGIKIELQESLPEWDKAFDEFSTQISQSTSVRKLKATPGEKMIAHTKRPVASESADQPSDLDATSPPPPRESLALNLSEGQRSSILKYTTLPDYLAQRLARKVTDETASQFTADELDEILDHVEGVGRRAKGNDKQKLLRIAEKVANLLGSDVDAADIAKRRFSKKADCDFQIKITLRGIDPPIWRRIQTTDCTLEELHTLIQVAMGWEFEHPYRFEIGGVEFADVEADEEEDVRDVRATKLSDVTPASHRRPRLYYEYDFGDEWVHQLIVEERLSPQAGVAYPRCIAGARACPPEDCGGPWGYADFLEALQDSSNPHHHERLEWVGGEFDSEAFDLKTVNKRLAKIR